MVSGGPAPPVQLWVPAVPGMSVWRMARWFAIWVGGGVRFPVSAGIPRWNPSVYPLGKGREWCFCCAKGAELSPARPPLSSVAGMTGVGRLAGPPWTSPAKIASLFRVPFALRRRGVSVNQGFVGAGGYVSRDLIRGRGRVLSETW